MLKLLTCSFFIVMTCTSLMGQQTWSKIYPGISSAGQGTVTEVIECPNGDLLLSGGNGDKYGVAYAFLMRLDQNGNQIWYKDYSGFHSFASLIRLDNGDIVAGGIGASNSYYSSVIKTDSLGNIKKAVEVEVDYFKNVKSIIKSPNGFIATADFAWELNDSMTQLNWIARLQPNGGTYDVEAVPGGYIVLGAGGLISGYNDIHLTKINSIGNPIWSMVYGGQRSDQAMDVEPTNDGGFLIGGWTDSFDAANRKYFLLKTDSLGQYEWGKTFNDQFYSNFGECILEDNAGNFYIGGLHQSDNVMIIKTDANGNSIWSKTYNSGTAYSMIQSSDGNIVVAGETRSFDFFVFKMDTAGKSICSESVVIDEYERLFLSDTSSAMGGISNSVYPASISAQGMTKTEVICDVLSADENAPLSKEEPISVSPIPATNTIMFSLSELSQQNTIEIYSSQGKRVEILRLEDGITNKTARIHHLSNGLYFFYFKNRAQIIDRGRFIVNR